MTKPRQGRDFTVIKGGGGAGRDDWRDRLLRGRGDVPKTVLANAALPMREAPEFAGAFVFDEFRTEIMVAIPLPWDMSTTFERRPLTDLDALRTTEWLQHHGVDVGDDVVGKAIGMVGQEARFHPVREYLMALEWDRRPRVDRWLSDYLGAADDPYTVAVARRFLIGCVARVLRPGCKLDTLPILEGSQGIGKSSTFKILGEPWFSDEIADLNSKDAAMQMRGVWLIELPELDALSAKEASAIKAFLSRSNDRYRPPYGRAVIEVPRQCVFAGSTNVDAYLKDSTGGRRFWPVKVKRADLRRLADDRDQLWAEALALYQGGEKWWLDTRELENAAAEQQFDRYIGDPWTERVQAFLGTRSSVSIADILDGCLFIDTGRQTRAEQMRVSGILTAHGWRRRRVRTSAGLVWRYSAPDEVGNSSDEESQ
jgi:predicted P-loop ATPase